MWAIFDFKANFGSQIVGVEADDVLSAKYKADNYAQQYLNIHYGLSMKLDYKMNIMSWDRKTADVKSTCNILVFRDGHFMEISDEN